MTKGQLMVIEDDFYAGGHLRWNLGWPTPNYAGAFLVTLLALMLVSSGSRWRWLGLTVEASGLFLVAKTYSRGAVLALGCAWAFYFMALRIEVSTTRRLICLGRVGTLALLLFASDFEWNRTTGVRDDRTVATEEDGAVVNRLSLWRCGLKMMGAAPWTGWGEGESGRAYMNWFQDADRVEKYSTMVNSYLTVGVEHGLWVLALAWLCGHALLALAWSGARRGDHVASAAGATLIAWGVANVFTTLWIEPKLWLLPGLAGAILLWRCAGLPAAVWKMSAKQACVGSGAVALVLYAAAWGYTGTERLRATPVSSDTVLLRYAGDLQAAEEVWEVWPDVNVLGPTPGHELRRWIENNGKTSRLIVHSGRSFTGAYEVERSIAFGIHAGAAAATHQARVCWLIHPLVPPPENTTSCESNLGTVLVLPEIDEMGLNGAWLNWAKKTRAKLVVSSRSGADIRAAWPCVVRELVGK